MFGFLFACLRIESAGAVPVLWSLESGFIDFVLLGVARTRILHWYPTGAFVQCRGRAGRLGFLLWVLPVPGSGCGAGRQSLVQGQRIPDLCSVLVTVHVAGAAGVFCFQKVSDCWSVQEEEPQLELAPQRGAGV
jgi:hypothetical protein